MADVTSTVVTIFKADTRQAKRALRDLEGENKKLAQAQIDQAEDQNAALDAQIAKWGKVAMGVGAAVVAYEGLSRAADRYAKQAQLENAAQGAYIEGIQKAAGGLITKFEALQFAAAATNTDFRLSQQEMEAVAKYMVVLRNEGNNLNVTFDELTKAIVEGNVEGLKKFGVIVSASAGTMEAHEAIMTKIADANSKAGKNINLAGDEAQKAKVRWKDALDQLVVSLGQVAVALAPIVESLAWGLDKFHRFGTWLGEGIAMDVVAATTGKTSGDVLTNLNDLVQGAYQRGRMGGESRLRSRQTSENLVSVANTLYHQTDTGKLLGRKVAALDKYIDDFFAEQKKGSYTFSGTEADGQRALPWSVTGYQVPNLAAVNANTPASLQGMLRFRGAGLGDFSKGVGKQFDSQLGDIDGQRAATDALNESLMNMASIGQSAFAQLASSAGEAFASMIDGTEMAAGGFEAMMGRILHAMSSQLFGEAIKESVMAVISVAKMIGGDPRAGAEAAAHGKAAAAAAAGGVAIAGMSKAFGGGGGGTLSVVPSAAAGRVGSGGAGVDTTRVYVVPTGLDDDPRATRKRIRDTLERSEMDSRR